MLAAIPVLIGVALKLSGSGGGGGGGGPAFFDQITGNGVFLALASLTVLLTLVLPLTVAVVAGDSAWPARPATGPCATCSRCLPGGPGC